MNNLSDDEDDDIEALRIAALESLKRKNQSNPQQENLIQNVEVYPPIDNRPIVNEIQAPFMPFSDGKMGFPHEPLREEPVPFFPDNSGYPPDGMNHNPGYPLGPNMVEFDCQLPPPPIENPNVFSEGMPIMNFPPNPQMAPPRPDFMFHPPPLGPPGPMLRPMFNEMGAPMHPRQMFRRQRGKRGKMGFQFRPPLHLRPPHPLHVRPPVPTQAPHHNLITLTESQTNNKPESTDAKVEEAPKQNAVAKKASDKDKIYNSLDLPQHRYCKVAAQTETSEDKKNEESSKFSRYEKEDSESSESSEEEEEEEEKIEEDPDVLNLLDDDEDDLDKLMEKMEQEMSGGESKIGKTKANKKAKHSSIVIYDTNEAEASNDIAKISNKELKAPISSSAEIRVVKFCDSSQELDKDPEKFNDPFPSGSNTNAAEMINSVTDSNAGVNKNESILTNLSDSRSNVENRPSKVDVEKNLEDTSSQSLSKPSSGRTLTSPDRSKTTLPPTMRSGISPPPYQPLATSGRMTNMISPSRVSPQRSVSPQYSKKASPPRFRSKSPSPYYSRKSPTYSRKSPNYSQPLRRYSRSPSPPYFTHRQRSSISPSFRSKSPGRSDYPSPPSRRYPHGRSPRSPARRMISPPRMPRSLSVSPPRYRSSPSPRSPMRRPLSPIRRHSPSRRPLSPSWRPSSPSRRLSSPSRRIVSPTRRPLSPLRRPLSPLRRPLSPGRRPLSPNRRPLSPNRRAGPISRPLSPERKSRRQPDSPPRRAFAPDLRSPIRRFSPKRSLSPDRRSLSPVRRPLSPLRRPLSPIRRPLSPSRRPLSPIRRPGSPSRRPLSPLRRHPSPTRRPLSPVRRPLSPNRRPLSPLRKPLSPPKRFLSPIRRHPSPTLRSPERRSQHASKRPFSPNRRPVSPSRRPLSPARRPLSPNRGHFSPGRRPLSPSRRLASPSRRSKSPIRGTLSPSKRLASPGRSPRDHASFSPPRQPGSPNYRRNALRRSPNSRHNFQKASSPVSSGTKSTSSSRQRSRSPRWKKSETDKRSTSPKDKRHRSPHSRKPDQKTQASSHNRPSSPKSNENSIVNTKRKFDAREKILDRRKQNENKSKKSTEDSSLKVKATNPVEQVDPVLEARRRKFESNDVVKPLPKKIKLSSHAPDLEGSSNVDGSRKALSTRNQNRVEPDDELFVPTFSYDDQIPLSNSTIPLEFPSREIPDWAENPDLPLNIKEEVDPDFMDTNISDDFVSSGKALKGASRTSKPNETLGEPEEPALEINFDPTELMNETDDGLNEKRIPRRSAIAEPDLIPQQPDNLLDSPSKPFIKIKPLTELLDKSVLKKTSKVKKKDEGEEKISKKKKKNKKHKIRDRESDEEGDLRNELKRRRAERLNLVGTINDSLPTRLVQSAFEGVMGRKRPKTKEDKPKKHKRSNKEEKGSKEKRRVLVMSSATHHRSSLSPVSDMEAEDEQEEELMFRRAEKPIRENDLLVHRAGGRSQSRRNVSRSQALMESSRSRRHGRLLTKGVDEQRNVWERTRMPANLPVPHSHWSSVKLNF